MPRSRPRRLTSAIDASLPTPGSLSLGIGRTFVSTIAGRDQPGIFGLGWTTSWQTSLSADASGNVTIDSGGSFGYFVSQPNGTYLDTDGESGTLTLSGGIYTFTATLRHRARLPGERPAELRAGHQRQPHHPGLQR